MLCDPSGNFAISAAALAVTAVLTSLAIITIHIATSPTAQEGFAGLADAIGGVINDVRNAIATAVDNVVSQIQSKASADSKAEDVATTPSKPRPKDPTHHIVAKADFRAEESRQILRGVGIEPLTDPRNLVVLPQSYHASMHTTEYHKYVTERLRPVSGDLAGVEVTLNSIRTEIIFRSVAGIRWR